MYYEILHSETDYVRRRLNLKTLPGYQDIISMHIPMSRFFRIKQQRMYIWKSKLTVKIIKAIRVELLATQNFCYRMLIYVVGWHVTMIWHDLWSYWSDQLVVLKLALNTATDTSQWKANAIFIMGANWCIVLNFCSLPVCLIFPGHAM